MLAEQRPQVLRSHRNLRKAIRLLVKLLGLHKDTLEILLQLVPKVLFSLPFARNFVSAFGTSTVLSALNCYLVGVKEKSRLAVTGGFLHLFLLAFSAVSLAVDVNAYVYIFRDSSAFRQAFTWLGVCHFLSTNRTNYSRHLDFCKMLCSCSLN